MNYPHPEVMVTYEGAPIEGVHVVSLFPNTTWKEAVTRDDGRSFPDLYEGTLPMTVFAAAPDYAAVVVRDWVPYDGILEIEMQRLANGGSCIFPLDKGFLPPINGRTLNAVPDDASWRLPAVSGQIDLVKGADGKNCISGFKMEFDTVSYQSAEFKLGHPMQITDFNGMSVMLTVIANINRAWLLEYRDVP